MGRLFCASRERPYNMKVPLSLAMHRSDKALIALGIIITAIAGTIGAVMLLL